MTPTDDPEIEFGEVRSTTHEARIRFPMLKEAAEFLLAHGGPATLAARRRRGRTLILAYHNIVPDDAPALGDRSLHLPFTAFRSQLERLEATHDIVAIGAVRGAIGSSSRPRAVITFDDSYRGALALGLPELVRRRLPATVFVAPGLLGCAGCWWDMLAVPDGRGLPPSVRNHVLDFLGGDGNAAIEWARTREMTLAAVPSHAGIATVEELYTAAALPGVTLGAHTWSHCNLARVNGTAFDKELVQPLAWLRERFECAVPWLAFPYGISTPRTVEQAQRAGYEGAVRIDGGSTPSGAIDAFVLPRLNVPSGLSADGFILRVSGLIGS